MGGRKRPRGPSATAYRARWRWRVRHVARYVEHGRIFNALTQPRSAPRHRLAIRLFEQRAGLHAPTCRREVTRPVAARSEQAYVSLEDTTEGRMALVVRADHPALRSRCSPTVALPTAHVRPAPAGVLLRKAGVVSLAWRDLLRLEDGRPVGWVEVRVRLSAVPSARPAAAHLGSFRPSSRTRFRTWDAKSGSEGGSSRPRPRRDSSVARKER
jgi:hypothetical protein